MPARNSSTSNRPAGRAARSPDGQAEPTHRLDAATDTPGDVSDRRDLEGFFDGLCNVQMASKHIAGAVIAVVGNDRIVFAKGYGYADAESRRRIDPETTMFRIASITKLFTCTAVMQQVEEGKLDLDVDVNSYLDGVQIPATFEQPVTLKHLMTHTAGFDDHVLGLFAHRRQDVPPLAQVLASQMPTRVRAPGLLASYSNHGTAIAGHAVACASGRSWENYVEERILRPLQMRNTLVQQPAADRLPADLSKGYLSDLGRVADKGFEYTLVPPAGSISTTAVDAAKFMLAHLNDGRFGEGRILQPETARRMREPLFRADPKTSAMCYGFMEERHGGERVVGHGGGTICFHSIMKLIPDRRVGLFVCYNTDSAGDGALDDLFNAFMRRYYPAPEQPRFKAADGFRERAKRLVGEYAVTSYSHTSFTKLSSLLFAVDVSSDDEDTLSIGIGGKPRRYVEVEPLVFQELDGPDVVVFQQGRDARGLYLFRANSPSGSAVRREWYESSWAHWRLLGTSLAVFASALLFWPVVAWSSRGLTSPTIRRTRFSGVLSVVAWLLSALSVSFAVGLAFALGDTNEIAFGLTPLLKGVLILARVCVTLAALTAAGCFVAWRNRYWRFSGRLHYTLVALAGVGFSWFLIHWNLVSTS
jgi:CubicO group peptidase (beta-lactamase class C family)